MKPPIAWLSRIAAAGIVALLAIPAIPAGAADDGAAFREFQAAVDAARSRHFTTARRIIRNSGDRFVRSAATWYLLTRSGNGASLDDYDAFLRDNPGWPWRDRLLEAAESSISDGTPPNDIIEWFEAYPPTNYEARITYLVALRKADRHDDAANVVADIWVNDLVPRSREQLFYRLYKRYLKPEHHRRRIDLMLWRGHVDSARRLLKTYPVGDDSYRRIYEARALLMSGRRRGSPGAVRGALAKIPEDVADSPALLYARIRWHRLREEDREAQELLAEVPGDLEHEDLWWRERAIQARNALREGTPEIAYRITSRHRQSAGVSFVDAEWISGWIALRFLDRPKAAHDHFFRMFVTATTPISSARGAYWLGRAGEDTGNMRDAELWYGVAARYPTTFYGQAAVTRLGAAHLALPEDPQPTDEERAAFENNDLVRAARYFDAVGEDALVGRFMSRLALDTPSEGAWTLLGALALDLNQPFLAVRTGKKAAQEGLIVVGASYPVIDVIDGRAPEKPLLLALIRQESEFRHDVISPAGARGLMQLMPGTARRVARSLKVKYSRVRLTRDAGYNMRLGAAYLNSLLEGYDGSYILALAAYNAGPNRVAEWLSDFGDPRSASVDPIDWIELIPFGETRNYVQRVLEGTLIYRGLLGERAMHVAHPSQLWYPPDQIAVIMGGPACADTAASEAPETESDSDAAAAC